MQIKILDVGVIETRQGPKKKYRLFHLAYSVDGQTRDKDIMEFSKVFKILSSSEPGQRYEIEAQKNSSGYVDWNEATLVTGEASAASASASPVGNTATRSSGSTWETKEERAAKQVYIIRQSCLSSAARYLQDKEDTTINDVIKTAKEFERYVLSVNVPMMEPELFEDDTEGIV